MVDLVKAEEIELIKIRSSGSKPGSKPLVKVMEALKHMYYIVIRFSICHMTCHNQLELVERLRRRSEMLQVMKVPSP